MSGTSTGVGEFPDDQDVCRLFRLDRDAIRCPSPYFARLRAEQPVRWVDEAEAFVVTRHEDILEVLRQPDRFSSALATGPVLDRQMADGITALLDEGGGGIEDVLHRVNRGRTRVLLSADPPVHQRQRNLVNRAFTVRRVRESEDGIRRIAESLADDFTGEREVELVSRFAVPLPLSVIADRIGVPRADMAEFKRWSDDFTVAVGNHQLTPEDLRDMLSSQAEFFEYFEARVVERRRRPTDDLLSEIANARLADGDELSMPELLGMLSQFLVAGNETTTKLLASAVRMMGESPLLVEQLRESRALIEPFLEEVLRLEAPVQGLYRVAVSDSVLGGQPIPAGAALWLAYASGNRDDALYDAPDELRLDRENLRQHLSFGFGEHYCLGAPLARAEARIGIEVLLDRLGTIDLAARNEFELENSYVLRGLRELWLTLDPSTPRGE